MLETIGNFMWAGALLLAAIGVLAACSDGRGPDAMA